MHQLWQEVGASKPDQAVHGSKLCVAAVTALHSTIPPLVVLSLAPVPSLVVSAPHAHFVIYVVHERNNIYRSNTHPFDSGIQWIQPSGVILNSESTDCLLYSTISALLLSI